MFPGPLTRRSPQSKNPQLQQVSDEEVMQAVQQGDGDAFAVLFDRFHRLVLVTALKIVRDVSEAEEVTQNVFLKFIGLPRNSIPPKAVLKCGSCSMPIIGA
jgi:hypothetical protein